MASYIDNFPDDPYVARWTGIINYGAWSAANGGEVNFTPDNGDCKARYNTPLVSLATAAQVSWLGTGDFTTQPGPAVRCHPTLADGYNAEWIDASGGGQSSIRFNRFNDSVKTNLAQVDISGTIAWQSHVYATVCITAEGAVGADVVLKAWLVNHGSSSVPSDPAYLNVGTEIATFTDTDGANRLNSSSHLYVGIMGGNTSGAGISQHKFWKAKDLGDAGGALPFVTRIGAKRI